MNSDHEILDQLADEFEAAWSAGRRPQVAGFLNRVAPTLRLRLAALLVPLDIGYRIRAGEAVTPEIWADLGPEYQLIVGDCLRDPVNRESPTKLSGFDVSAALLAAEQGSGRGDSGSSGDSPTLDTPSGRPRGDDLPTAPAQSTGRKSQVIGNYKLLQKLGEGGMGTVWMAEQERPRPAAGGAQADQDRS